MAGRPRSPDSVPYAESGRRIEGVVRSAESGAARTVTLVAVLALLLAAGTVIALDATGHLAGGVFADPRPHVAATKVAAPPGLTGYPRGPSLAALPEQPPTALRGGGVTSAVVRVDDSLFGGPAVSPDWQPSYVRSGVVAPVSALSTASARHRRTGDPAIAT